MTENEAKSKLDSLHYKIIHTSFCNKVYESEIEALCLAKDVLQEIQQYRAIGTIDEFKALKRKKPFATVKFSKDDLQEITDKIMKDFEFDIECDVKEIRNKAINEFAERLKSDEFQKYNLDMVFETSRDLSYSDCIDAFHEYIDEIAEQLKAGGDNEVN